MSRLSQTFAALRAATPRRAAGRPAGGRNGRRGAALLSGVLLLLLAGAARPAETEVDSDFMQAVEDELGFGKPQAYGLIQRGRSAIATYRREDGVKAEIFFDQVMVPVANRIGEENRGWDYAKFLMGNSRLNVARLGLATGRIQKAKAIAAPP